MKIRFLRLIALVLTAAVLLSGCGMVDFDGYFGAVRSLVDGNAIVPYESMTYERPDMTQLQQTLEHPEVDGQHLGHEDGVLLLHLLGKEETAGVVIY